MVTFDLVRFTAQLVIVAVAWHLVQLFLLARGGKAQSVGAAMSFVL